MFSENAVAFPAIDLWTSHHIWLLWRPSVSPMAANNGITGQKAASGSCVDVSDGEQEKVLIFYKQYKG